MLRLNTDNFVASISSSRAYANPKVVIVTTLLLYAIINVNIIHVISQYVTCINIQGTFTFAVYKLNMMNRNDIYVGDDK
jgi:hypothetical protein